MHLAEHLKSNVWGQAKLAVMTWQPNRCRSLGGERVQCPAVTILRVLLTQPSSLCPARARMVLHVVRRAHLGSSLLLPLQPQIVEWKDGGDASSIPYPTIIFDVFLSSSPGPPFVPLPRKGMDKVACSQEGTIQLPPCAGLWRLRLNSRPHSPYTVRGCIVL